MKKNDSDNGVCYVYMSCISLDSTKFCLGLAIMRAVEHYIRSLFDTEMESGLFWFFLIIVLSFYGDFTKKLN